MIKIGNAVNTKFVKIMKIYNFHFCKLFVWHCLDSPKFEFKKKYYFQQDLTRQMVLGAKRHEHKSCRSQQDTQLFILRNLSCDSVWTIQILNFK
jgi:hypothetical protein